MLDSDTRFPGDRPNAHIVTEVSEHVAFVHLLDRRSIENYVPKKYFRRRLSADGQVHLADAYFRMTEAQQTHFPIKRGFFAMADSRQPQTPAAFQADTARPQSERDLFGTVDPADWHQLARGFGEKLASVYTDTAYRCEPNEGGEMPLASQTELGGFLTKLIQYL